MQRPEKPKPKHIKQIKSATAKVIIIPDLVVICQMMCSTLLSGTVGHS